ncbi:glycoside hydrolase family 75 protein [Serratia entomophila]|uniref:glycoside hydrolase family 75 protein n=1 Tax=Serratia entomophila TaxID=42906 RepID=UPI002179FDFE|nr:glycoside hydrolase family 75 protein [Serratia entomophila]CAI1005386.1 Fungal chitosanase [Serratia entomophila]CAI1555353.1 Fungal chitosanase [Serratia entomophila]CAI1655101.1 Fungal chitosanase [Serratia entomophila]CAI1711726.1 Fungal chitosanase [Serratia entomophila]CAI1796473.1 Fungal chitosanase [Serratia entomophila]
MSKIITHPWKNRRISPDEPGMPDPVVMIQDDERVLIVADADTDADGSPDAVEIDPTGQRETSLRRGNGWRGEGDYVNARVIPYYVIPGNWRKVTGIAVKMGDVAKISYKNRYVYAICADVGGESFIGEASIAAVEALGINPWNKNKKKIIRGVGYGVTYEIVTGSASLNSTINFETIQAYGRELFRENPPFSLPVKHGGIAGVELRADENGTPAAIITSTSGEQVVKRYSDTFELGLVLQSLPRVKIAIHSPPGLPAINVDGWNHKSGGSAEKFVSLFSVNYRAIREAVEDWFVPEYSPKATINGCVAHQVSCLKLCALPYPQLGSMASINVDYFAEWALKNGWKKITHRNDMLPGDICVSGPIGHPDQFDHVYCFASFSAEHPGYAAVFDNQYFGVHPRSLDGAASTIGEWRYAIRMP